MKRLAIYLFYDHDGIIDDYIPYKLEKLKERERILKEQIKREQAKINARNRKVRTKRLIEVGATLETALGVEFPEPNDRQNLYEALTKIRTNQSGYEYNLAKMIVNDIRKIQK